MEYVWSALNNAFFPKPFLFSYIEGGWNIDDAIDIDGNTVAEFISPRQGKIRVAGSDGMPAWGDIPPPTQEELITQAESEKQSRIAQANDYISSKQWPGKAAMGRLTDSEKTKYNAWLDYLDALEAVDTTTAPDVNWPVEPEM